MNPSLRIVYATIPAAFVLWFFIFALPVGNFWLKLTGRPHGAVIYAGDHIQRYSDGITVFPWDKMEESVAYFPPE